MKLDKETMIRSYGNISFSPERRGESDFAYYSHLLAGDLKTLGDPPGNYERKFIQRVMMIYHRQARCASVMITGAGNFPFRHNQKRNESQRRAEDDFTHWRKKYINAATRERTLSPEEEIDKTLGGIDRLEARKAIFKECNDLPTMEAKVKFLTENKLFDKARPYLMYENGSIPSYALTSITTKIRERKKKLEIMKVRIDRKETFERIDFPGGYVDIENDRVVIKHHEKPPREVIEIIKANGFRYSPKTVSWVRKHTGNAIHDAKRILPKIQIQRPHEN